MYLKGPHRWIVSNFYGPCLLSGGVSEYYGRLKDKKEQWAIDKVKRMKDTMEDNKANSKSHFIYDLENFKARFCDRTDIVGFQMGMEKLALSFTPSEWKKVLSVTWPAGSLSNLTSSPSRNGEPVFYNVVFPDRKLLIYSVCNSISFF